MQCVGADDICEDASVNCVWADDLCLGVDLDSAPTAGAYAAVDVH